METAVQGLRSLRRARRSVGRTIAIGLLLTLGFSQLLLAQAGTNQLAIFKNYFVTGDYVTAGWVEASSDGTFATGTISVPDPKNPAQSGLPTTVPQGADVVAAYLYWGTVEGNSSTFKGQQAFFNGYPITGTVLISPSGTVSWSSGGCSGSAQGSKTMRFYRADVRPYMPVDLNPASPTFGTIVANTSYTVRMADSGKNGNTQPNALGATLVIIYRVLSPAVPLNAIVLYDGAYAPSNTVPNFVETMQGFYQPALSPSAKITHVVANGQTNKGETVFFGANQLPALYTATFGANSPPFPGLYGMWDNPTWSVGNFVNGSVSGFDTSETTSVIPASTQSGCVSWGAIVFSTTVQDTDGDGLLDAWENNNPPGYTDAVSGQWVALQGADPLKKDIFVEVDYLNNLDGSAGAFKHSHLPKQAAIDAVGGAFASQTPPINIHFDLGANIYPGDPYVIQYPVAIPNPLPAGTLAPQAGTGGNSISEGALFCVDAPGTPPCPYPNQPAIGWKSGFQFVQSQTALGNFQPGRGQSYHYMFFGHSLGAPRSFWSTFGNGLADPATPQLVSIVNTGTSATVQIQSPQGVVKPGDCTGPAQPFGCSDLNTDRVTITGALGQTALNGTYVFSKPSSSTSVVNGVTVSTTTFTITTANLPTGTTTYGFNNEPQLAVAYLGPTSTSGHSDFGGGGDSAVTLGLWGADDSAGCQPDPSQPLAPGQTYCANQTGTVPVQTGTILHELGHTLTLTHGGTYYNDALNPSLPTYELNCKPNYLSVMSYLMQVRGFVDGGFDYSGQTLPPLNETTTATNGVPPVLPLSEIAGIGVDLFTGHSATHLTRWYSAPNALDTKIQNTTGGRFAKTHCDGTPLTSTEVAACALNPQNCSVRVDGTVGIGGTFSAPLDFNNDLIFPNDPILAPGVDVNYNGFTGDTPFSGFNDWQVVNPTPSANGVALQQMSVRANAFETSSGGVKTQGGGVKTQGGGIDDDGGGVKTWGGGVKTQGGGVKTQGGGVKTQGGGIDQDEDTATSTVDPPGGLTCSIAQGAVPGCTSVLGGFLENAKSVPLTWSPPGFGQIRRYDVWRAVGSFPTRQQVLLNLAKFTDIKTLTGAPPATTFTDPNVKNGITYTYFVTDANKQGAQSGQSDPLVVTVKF